MHREPRGAESAEIAFGEVRLPVGAGKAKYPRTFSALRNLRGCFVTARSEVEQRY